MLSLAKSTALGTGFLIGAFLFLQSFGAADQSGWWIYQAGALVAAIGLAGLFSAQCIASIVGLALAPFLITSARFGIHVAKDPACCNLGPPFLVALLFIGFAAPLLGLAISRFLAKFSLNSQVASLFLLSATLICGLFFPGIKTAQQRHAWQEAARFCATTAGRPHELYTDVCSDHDQFDAVLSCQLQNSRHGDHGYLIRQAGRKAVNDFMQEIKPKVCR